MRYALAFLLLWFFQIPRVTNAAPQLTRSVVSSAAVSCSTSVIIHHGSLGGLSMRAALANEPFTMLQGFWVPWSQSATGVEMANGPIFRFALHHSRPNPFNPQTTINFVVPSGGYSQTRLTIYDVGGRAVKTLVDKSLLPGIHTVIWDGRDHEHRPLASGVYYARLQCGKQTQTRQLVLLK